MTAKHDYKPLRVGSSSSDMYISDACDDKEGAAEPRCRLASRRLVLFTLAFSTFSLVFTSCTLLYVLLLHTERNTALSSFAGLSRDLDLPFVRDTRWDNNGNRTAEDEAWKEWYLDPELALVALSDSFTESHNLPSAQRWPWDSEKGIYFVNGIHNMHCIQFFRRSIMEAYDGKMQSLPKAHLTHCLDAMREDIMCNADDTLRYTGRLHAQANELVPISGIGSTRKCRDWFKLTDWIEENSACYGSVSANTPGFKESDRYKHCPDGKVYWDD